MPALLAGAAGAIGSIVVKMILGIVENPAFIQEVFLVCADKLVKSTKTDLDDHILDAAKKALGVTDDNTPKS